MYDRRMMAMAMALACLVAGSLASGSAAAPAPARPPAAEPRKPNIVLIVADDLGYGETGAQGYATDIPTPHIDAIARSGVRFTQGYVSAPLCSPTRAGLMTGRYQQRFGHEFNPGPKAKADAVFGLPRSEATLAERLQSLGYATGMVGKWHLGYSPEKTPTERGFGSFFGFLGGAHPYLPGGGGAEVFRGSQAVTEKEYLTDAFAREAVASSISTSASRSFSTCPSTRCTRLSRRRRSTSAASRASRTRSAGRSPRC